MGDQHKISRARFLAAAGGAAAAGTLAHPARARSGAPERPKATAAAWTPVTRANDCPEYEPP